jgi:hypothetical protein
MYTMITVSVTSSYTVSSGTGKQISVAPSTVNNVTAVFDPNLTIGYTLYDQGTGTLVTGGTISAQGGTLNFSSVPSGIYLLRLDTGNGTYDTHRVLLK